MQHRTRGSTRAIKCTTEYCPAVNKTVYGIKHRSTFSYLGQLRWPSLIIRQTGLETDSNQALEQIRWFPAQENITVVSYSGRRHDSKGSVSRIEDCIPDNLIKNSKPKMIMLDQCEVKGVFLFSIRYSRFNNRDDYRIIANKGHKLLAFSVTLLVCKITSLVTFPFSFASQNIHPVVGILALMSGSASVYEIRQPLGRIRRFE